MQLKNINSDYWWHYANLTSLDLLVDIIVRFNRLENIDKLSILQYYEYMVVKSLNKMDKIITIQKNIRSLIAKRIKMEIKNKQERDAIIIIQSYSRRYMKRNMLYLLKALMQIDIRLEIMRQYRKTKASNIIRYYWLSYNMIIKGGFESL